MSATNTPKSQNEHQVCLQTLCENLDANVQAVIEKLDALLQAVNNNNAYQPVFIGIAVGGLLVAIPTLLAALYNNHLVKKHHARNIHLQGLPLHEHREFSDMDAHISFRIKSN
jgi:hypothetical protein